MHLVGFYYTGVSRRTVNKTKKMLLVVYQLNKFLIF